METKDFSTQNQQSNDAINDAYKFVEQKTLELHLQKSEKPIFIACADKEIVNRLDDFFITLNRVGEENYKLLVIAPDITQKLFEQYWFSKLQKEEQEALIKMQNDKAWHDQAFDLAVKVKEYMEKWWEDNDVTPLEFQDFGISQLKSAILHTTKRKPKLQDIKNIIDTLMVFGYITKVTETTVFEKMRFQFTINQDSKIEMVRQKISALKARMEHDNELLLQLTQQERELLNFKIQPNGTTANQLSGSQY